MNDQPNPVHLASCGYSLGARTILARWDDGTVTLHMPQYADAPDELVGRMLDRRRILVTSASHSIKSAAFRALRSDRSRALRYSGERRTDPETGRDCPVWEVL